MRTKNKLFILAALALVLITSACKPEDVDTTAPTMENATFTPVSPATELTAGSSALVSVLLKDDMELGQLKIDIHDGFDLHSHGHNKTLNTPWALTKNVDFSGTEVLAEETLDIPADAASGPYHLILRLLDAEGNEGDFVEIDFDLAHAGQAVIDVTSPVANVDGEIILVAGSELNLAGTVTDDSDLEEVSLLLLPEDGGDAVMELDADLTGTSDTSFDLSSLEVNAGDFTVPNSPGHYELIIVAKDSDGNMTVWESHSEIE